MSKSACDIYLQNQRDEDEITLPATERCTYTQLIIKGARNLLIIHEVLVAMDFFSAGVQDKTLEEESQRLAS